VLSCARLGDETGGDLGPPLRQEPRAAIRHLVRHGGQTSRAPVPRTSDLGLGGEGAGDSLDARSRTRGCGLRRSQSPIPRTAWWPGRPSVERPSEAAGQGVLCAPPVHGHGRRARAWTPCPSHPLGRSGRREAGCVESWLGRAKGDPTPFWIGLLGLPRPSPGSTQPTPHVLAPGPPPSSLPPISPGQAARRS
jgi:hypothetical protein